MTKRNLKIAITPEQPLDEVVVWLERRGYVCFAECKDAKYVIAHDDGFYQMVMFSLAVVRDWPLTTLAELKEME